MSSKKNYIAEALGTFILVFCGTAAMAVNEITQGAVTHVGIGITWGFVVIAMIYAFGEISGAHFNPAVTIAFAFAKKFSLLTTLKVSCVDGWLKSLKTN